MTHLGSASSSSRTHRWYLAASPRISHTSALRLSRQSVSGCRVLCHHRRDQREVDAACPCTGVRRRLRRVLQALSHVLGPHVVASGLRLPPLRRCFEAGARCGDRARCGADGAPALRRRRNGGPVSALGRECSSARPESVTRPREVFGLSGPPARVLRDPSNSGRPRIQALGPLQELGWDRTLQRGPAQAPPFLAMTVWCRSLGELTVWHVFPAGPPAVSDAETSAAPRRWSRPFGRLAAGVAS